MAKPIELLLLRTVENLGIVGDLVTVRAGFARNYLLPHALAEHPTDAKIESLKAARATAVAEIAATRAQRERTINKLTGVNIKLTRSCNDQGVLYGSITQRDIADALVAAGYAVDMRAVRLAAPFRRIGSYVCTIQFEKELKADITIDIAADRALEMIQAQRDADEAAAATIEASEAEDRVEMATKGPRRKKD
ncbi:MAG: 50S ribosomal protein L9 [Planctomycetota bacterium]|jgi:large subunit ribosomal protein L9|nr:MAG: 50S ribosomal protein L9 [Planctomycetota bacterium]RLS96903.1 MAG: 50S ribosomal protein L9 [Planctomycetota bacterium]